MSIPMAPSSEIFIDDILKKSLIFKEKRLDLIGRKWMAVYKDKKCGTWYTSFLYVDWTGKRCRKLKRGFLTKKAA